MCSLKALTTGKIVMKTTMSSLVFFKSIVWATSEHPAASMFEMEAFHKRKAHLNIILFIATWQYPEEGERGKYGLFVHIKV